MMIDVQIDLHSDIVRTPRVQQLEGLFDIAPAKRSELSSRHTLNLPEKWNIGVIVGPSGSGKTTLARRAFPSSIIERFDWSMDKSVIDGFPASIGIRDITGLLCSVGFNSPPAWLRPFHVLSNGEQFRVHIARMLAESRDIAVVDEFTSVVDRTVAQIGSAAVAKAVRRRGQKLVAVTCHYDVLDWLEPDWIYQPVTGELEVADAARGLLRRRPAIELEIGRSDPSAWRLFKPHHYLSADLHKAARCYVAFY